MKLCFGFNLAIDDIRKQPIKELKEIKEALEMGFEYLDHPLAYNYVKDQVVIILKSRCGWLKKWEKGEERSWNCFEPH